MWEAFKRRKRYPMKTWNFTVMSVESGLVDTIEIRANYWPQAEYDAERAFYAMHGEQGVAVRDK